MSAWFSCILSQTESSCRCPCRVHPRCPVQRLGQGRHHQERSRDLLLTNRPIPGHVATPLRRFLHISPREFLGLWTFRTLRSALGCARSGVRVNPSTMVNSLFSYLEFFSLIFGQYGFEGTVRRISTTKVYLLGSGPDGNRSKTGYEPLTVFV